MEKVVKMKENIQSLMNSDYRTFIKALISIEKEICSDEELDIIYDRYMENDSYELLSCYLFDGEGDC